MDHPQAPRHPTDRLIGTCPAIVALRRQIQHLAAFDTLGNPAVPTVLLQGTTGTGKGLVARIIHDSGPRAQGPFLDVNCAAIPETLLETELFGVTAGAFTDAKHTKPGLFEAASGGTLFLDEIDTLPLALQGKLLTAIETKRVRRVGAVREQAVDVKVVAATQAELSTRVAAGQFRPDLYHRLAVLVLALPPLRERGEDIVCLAQQFLQQYAAAHRLPPKRLSRAATEWLQRHDWPGNVRELCHLMERVTLLSSEARIDPETLARLCLPQVLSATHGVAAPPPLPEPPRDEPVRITQALLQTNGNVVQAARVLGLSRKALRYRMQRYGLEHPRAAEQGEATVSHQDTGDAGVPGAAWEQKPVAVLAIEVTWPAAREPDALPYEPWTVHARWEHTVLEKVQGFGGVVLQRGPSLLLVAFGLPHTLEQLPQRAVQTACGIRQLTAAWPAAGGWEPQPAVRQAVHWGHVLVDGGASDPTARVLPIAETLAAPVRLLGHTAPGEILVSASVARLGESWFELQACPRPMGEVPSDRAGASAVLGLRPQRSSLALHGQRPLSRFVGRVREVALLAELLGQVAEGRGHVVGIVGEPGVGKSRLVYELVHSPHAQGWRVLESAAVAYGTAIPYFPILALLRRSAHVEACDDVRTIRAKVTAHVRTLDATLQDTLPALLALLDTLPEDDPFLRLDPPQRRHRTLDACTRVVLGASQAQPLLLICEDGHWLDAETQALLDALVERLPRARLLVLVTYRPEYQHGWGSKTYYTQVRLDPLSPGSADELLQALLGEDPSLESLKRRLIERTAGNPFFLEESVRTLVETQGLVGAPGAYRLAHPLTTMQVPATVQAVLAARLDRLPPEAKRLLQTAAVIGQDVPLALLATIAECAEDVLHRGLAHLQAAEFLYETRLVPDRAYTFKHALTHEVAYSSVLQERRRALHARIVEALEALYPECLADQVERLADHACRGAVWQKAIAYCRQAGAKALAGCAYREAVGYLEQALAALTHLPSDRSTLEQAIDVRCDLHHALLPLTHYERMLTHLRGAETLAEGLADQRRLGLIYYCLANTLRNMQDYEPALAYGQHAHAVATTLGDGELQLWATLQLGYLSFNLGAYRQAVAYLQQALMALQQEPRSQSFFGHPAIHIRTWMVMCLSELGAFTDGAAYGNEALQMAEAVDHPHERLGAYWRVGSLYVGQGTLPQAIPLLERGVTVGQEADFPLYYRNAATYLALAYTLAGRATDALPLLGQIAGNSVVRGEAYLLAGDVEEAHRLAQRGLAHARDHHMRGHEARALWLLAESALQRDPPDAAPAAVYYQQALTLADECGMRPLQAHCHRGLGTLYAATGQREQARAELSTAIALYRAMDMTFWLPQTEAALAQMEGR
jgi:DNA-binding NtrC family response regulator/tetratricopeptide (TPR) repeat protein